LAGIVCAIGTLLLFCLFVEFDGMKLIWQLLMGVALCGVCYDVAWAQNEQALPGDTGLPVRAADGQAGTRLARLPAVAPMGMPGSGGAFSDWYRADVQLAPDVLDGHGWVSGTSPDLAPWRLFPPFEHGWMLTGSMAFGGTANPARPPSRFNGPVTFNDRADGQLSQMYLSAHRTSDAAATGFDWGCRVDLMFGTDYIFVQSNGLETQPNGDNAWNGLTSGNGFPDLYGAALPQAYVDLDYQRFKLRMGHFYTIMGYEGVPATTNFFSSPSYALQYGEPLTHTGGMLGWQGDRIGLQAGIVNGWDKSDGVQDDAAVLGGITFAGRRSTLGFSLISGREAGVPSNGRRTMYSLVWQTVINQRLAYVLQHDYASQDDALSGAVDAQWYGVSQYLFLAFNDAWKLGARYEWFHDDDGTRLAGVPVRNGGSGIAPAAAAGTYYNATLGANWTPNANLTVRPEIRWDWSENTTLAPFADLTSDSQVTFTADVVYIF